MVQEALLRLLQTCIKKRDLLAGKELYSQIAKQGLDLNVVLGSHVIRLFSECGSFKDSIWIFHSLPEKNVWTWSITINAYVKTGQSSEGISLFKQMQQNGVSANGFVFVSVLKACSDADTVKLIHFSILEASMESDVHIRNTLINIYGKLGNLEESVSVFNQMTKSDTVSWNAVITACLHCACYQKAIMFFLEMMSVSVKPNSITLASVLKACSATKSFVQAMLIHLYIVTLAFESNQFIGTTLIEMYSKRGCLDDARIIFKSFCKDDVVAWNAMIGGCVECGYSGDAIKLFHLMQKHGLNPDSLTFVNIMQACSSIMALEDGRNMYAYAIEINLVFNSFMDSSLIDMYAKCNQLEDALCFFNKIVKKDLSSWNAVMTGFVNHSLGMETLWLYEKLCKENYKPDATTLVILAKACSVTKMLDHGFYIHSHVIEAGLESTTIVANALVDMYTKCGASEDVFKVFNGIKNHDQWTWNAMIAGSAQRGDYQFAWKYFNLMQHEGFHPTYISFVSLLSSCSYKGFVAEGCSLFKSIREEYMIPPTIELYNCMVDILGRAGCLQIARDILVTIPFEFNLFGWVSLLTSSRTHTSSEIGQRCFSHAFEIDFKYASGYQLMSSIYADTQMDEDLFELQIMKSSVGAWKKPGQAFLVVEGSLHEFTVGAFCNDCTNDLARKLSMRMKYEGHIPNVDSILVEPSVE